VVTSVKQSPVFKGHSFLSCHRKFHMNWTSFKRSPVLKGNLFFVSKVTSDLLIQVWLYMDVNEQLFTLIQINVKNCISQSLCQYDLLQLDIHVTMFVFVDFPLISILLSILCLEVWGMTGRTGSCWCGWLGTCVLAIPADPYIFLWPYTCIVNHSYFNLWFVNVLRQFCGFLGYSSLPIKLTTMISMKYCWKWH
jgi:hypothetical protein